jgi:hypothetical protein
MWSMSDCQRNRSNTTADCSNQWQWDASSQIILTELVGCESLAKERRHKAPDQKNDARLTARGPRACPKSLKNPNLS